MNSAIRVTDGGGMRRVEIDRPEKADALDTGMMLEIARGECELQAQEHALVELIDALASLEIPVLALAHGRTLGAGGQQRSLLEQIAFIEEMERANAPRAGAAIQASALMLFGTPAQQARHLPEILRGEAIHGMGYSEPNAGSDLAVLRTTAARDGDE